MPYSDQIKDAFLASDYKFYQKPPDFNLAFIKDIETQSGVFQICITDIHTDMIELPTAYLISAPESLANTRLPDLNPDNSICYINSEIHNLFPLNPGGAIATCIELIEKVVDTWASNKISEYLQEEFSSYWQGQNIVFSTGEKLNGLFCRYHRLNLKGESSLEFIYSDDEEQARRWVQIREGNEVTQFCPALTLEIRQHLYVPNNCAWPPASLKDLFNWLRLVDHIAYQVLLNKLVTHMNSDSNRKILFCFKQESEMFAAHIKFSKAAEQLLRRAKGYTKAKNLKKRQKRENKAGRFKQLAAILCKEGMVQSFTRLMVEEASPSFLFQRNQPDNITLAGKRIALIGCGTIGAYTAQILTQSGAGGGQGSLTLLGADLLKRRNYRINSTIKA